MRYLLMTAIVLVAALGCNPANDFTFSDTQTLAQELSAVEGAPPGYAIVIVGGEGRSYLHTAGTASLDTEEFVTEQTPFYITSVTKGVVGLMAAILNASGAIDLDKAVGDYLPRLELPPPLDPKRITGYDLLTHRSRIENGSLIQLTAYSGAPNDDRFYEILREDTVALEAPFTYANEGYVVYSQIVKEVLGRDWRDQLTIDVLAPLGMRQTFGRTSSAVSGNEIAYGHVLTEDGWVVLPPKSDSIMHAAGGLYMSPVDAQIWLSTMVDPASASNRSGIPIEAFEDVQSLHVEQDRQLLNFSRRSYGLGWNIGSYEADLIYEHGGGYKGARSFFAFLPEREIGVAVMTNGDGAALRFAIALAEHAVDEAIGKGDLEARHRARLEEFSHRTPREFAKRRDERSRLFGDVLWKPSQVMLAQYQGVYRHERRSHQ